MIYRGYTFSLSPSDQQSVLMGQMSGVCRLIWNLALEQRHNHWRQHQRITGHSISFASQCRELTLLRQEFDFIREGCVTSQQRTLRALDDAFKRMWRGIGGFPKPKKKATDNSFSFTGREISVERINRRWGRLRLPKLGWVKFRMTRPIQGSICEATISKTELGWQVSIGCKEDLELTDNGHTAGIDRGVTIPVMLSDGTQYHLPQEIAVIERTCRAAQRKRDKRKIGSRRWHKASDRIRKLRAKQARMRKHWAHEVTTDISRRFGGVVIERLRTKDMTKAAHGQNAAGKRGLNRAILNIGWHRIERQLSYKVPRLIRVDPAYSSQTCSSCGTVDKRSRKNQASFVCSTCGHAQNADWNAALVILNRGSTPGVEHTRWGCNEARTTQAA